MDNPIVARVCKHAFLSFNRYDKDNDLLVAKITRIYKDGKREDVLAQIPNYKRPFYIVKPIYRNFKDKKDYIEADKCKKFTSNESRLGLNISKILFGIPNPNSDITELKNNPYVFGCNESVPVVYKQKYFDKYEEYQSKEAYTIGAYDVETYILKDGSTGDVNMASITSGSRAYWCGVRSFFQGDDDETILRRLKETENELVSEYVKKHNVNIEYELVDTPGQCVYNCVQAFHRFAPDYIVSWNAGFDMRANEKMLLNEGYDLNQVYSDPSIPKPYQKYSFYKGREFKRKVDGTMTSLSDHEKFPVVSAPAKWQWFDGMSFYAIKRVPQGKKESYSLQFTAEAEGVDGKLYTKYGQHLTPGSAAWHKYMQTYYPYVYALYNIRDNWTIEDVNRVTNDYSLSLPALITSSELRSYQSQPSMISDKLSFIALKEGYVWGVVGRNKEDIWKNIKPDLKNWIALLHSELNEDNGKCIYQDLNHWKSKGHGATNDIDVTGAYPHITVAENVSNKTTQVEVCAIEGLDRIEFRRFGVNYASSPEANATELAKVLYGMPEITEIRDYYVNIILPAVNDDSKEEEKKAA